ncbi:hypothetical protein ACFSTC_15555 [Nonomuraea ferruginea]
MEDADGDPAPGELGEQARQGGVYALGLGGQHEQLGVGLLRQFQLQEGEPELRRGVVGGFEGEGSAGVRRHRYQPGCQSKYHYFAR